MAEEKDSTHVPRFDGYYDHWNMMMENLFHSKGYWNVVRDGIPVAAVPATSEQTKLIEDATLKDFKAKNFLFRALDREIMETILEKDTEKGIWDAMKQKHKGTTKVKKAQLQTLRREFELLGMKDDEKITSYFSRTLAIVNKIKAQGEIVNQTTVVEKVMRSLPSKFNYVVCSIEESHDVSAMSIDDLQSKLMVQESRMLSQEVVKEEDQALKVTGAPRGRGRGCGFRGGRGRGRKSQNKEAIECYHCRKTGHYG